MQPLSIVEQTFGGSANRKGRARRRTQLHATAAEAASYTGLSFLRANTVRPQTHEQYSRAQDSFQRWLREASNGRSNLDETIENYLHHMYFAGALASEASAAVAAMEYFAEESLELFLKVIGD